MENFQEFISTHYGVGLDLFFEALKHSPSAQGYVMGAISELLLQTYLEDKGFEVIRIKEKPAGGNDAKNEEARGDFYIRKKNSQEDKWLVVECKGLKSNSEFRGSKLDSKEKLFRFMRGLAFPASDYKTKTFQKGYQTYLKAKEEWESKNKGKSFPPFRWKKETPGPLACLLSGLWRDEKDFKEWIDAQPQESFEEKAYRQLQGPIIILETHKPSKRVCSVTGINQAAPLVNDFNILAVDLFLRTGKHIFAFTNAENISHSPSSPSHLYQNYTIDILVKGKKEVVAFNPPWYEDIFDCINKTNPAYRIIDNSQLENRF